MQETTNTPAFLEGSTVRDRQTGLEYTATGETIPGNGQPVYWAMVTGADGVERQLPACDLEPVEVARISDPTKEQPALETRSGAGQTFTEYVDMLDSTGEIRATISDDGLDVTIGYERDFTIGGENGPTTFPLDAAHVSEFIRLLQRVEAAL